MNKPLQRLICRDSDGRYYAYRRGEHLKFVKQKRYAFCTNDPATLEMVLKHIRMIDPDDEFYWVPRYKVQSNG